MTDTQRLPVALAVHGGAGTIRKDRLTQSQEQAYRTALEDALSAGHRILLDGGSSLDAVVAAVMAMEDSPLFNAGRGSVLNESREVEMEASIMAGHDRTAGAVTRLRRVKNPIALAAKVLLHSPHVMLSGSGAEVFAESQGLPFEAEDYFITEQRLAQWLKTNERGTSATTLSETDASDALGTVGAVARDIHGHLAAATSTGGMTNKRRGRIGDSPIIGAGTYADERVAVSCTGHGEFFIRAAAAHDVCARVRYQQVTLQAALDAVILQELPKLGGTGGAIGIDHEGNLAFSIHSAGMYRGSIDAHGRRMTAIFK